MPCQATGHEETWQQSADKATKAACEAFKKLDELSEQLTRGLVLEMSGESQTWWLLHKRHDVEREAEEFRMRQLRDAAKAKLSPEELYAVACWKPGESDAHPTAAQ